MPILLIGGFITLIFGVIFFFSWFASFVVMIKAILPAIFIVVGAVATYLGWEALRDSKGATMDFSSPDEASRYTTEAQSYQQEINGFRNDQTASKVVIVHAEIKEEIETNQNPAPQTESEALPADEDETKTDDNQDKPQDKPQEKL